MGGLDARYMASILNTGKDGKFQIASITSLSCPHHGSIIASLWMDYLTQKKNIKFQQVTEIGLDITILRPLLLWISSFMYEKRSFENVQAPSYMNYPHKTGSPSHESLFHTLYHLSPYFMEHFFNRNVNNVAEIQYFSVGGDISNILVILNANIVRIFMVDMNGPIVHIIR